MVLMLSATFTGMILNHYESALAACLVLNSYIPMLSGTGGNSGSPTLNSKGELVGLLFDGNYESLSAGWIFNPELTRSIHVDTRYMRWVMDEVDHAEHLLEEMGLPHD